jgi:hypothetical protein
MSRTIHQPRGRISASAASSSSTTHEPVRT